MIGFDIVLGSGIVVFNRSSALVASRNFCANTAFKTNSGSLTPASRSLTVAAFLRLNAGPAARHLQRMAPTIRLFDRVFRCLRTSRRM